MTKKPHNTHTAAVADNTQLKLVHNTGSRGLDPRVVCDDKHIQGGSGRHNSENSIHSGGSTG